jgi:signal transduction histidine kinase
MDSADKPTRQPMSAENLLDGELETTLNLFHRAMFALHTSMDFSLIIKEILFQLQRSGLSFTSFSVYLIDRKALQATRYPLHSQLLGEKISLAPSSTEYHVCTTHQSVLWQDPHSPDPLWHLTVPSALGVTTISAYRESGFTPAEQRILERFAGPVEMLVVRYRDLDALEMLNAKMIEGEKLRALGEMVAVLAHEVRNPLGAIENCLAVLRRLSPLPDRYREMIELTNGEVRRLNKLVEDLLVFSKPGMPQFTDVDLANLAREVVWLVQQDPEFPPDVALEGEYLENRFPCRGDAVQLREVLLNLTLNAIQACAPAGQVTLTIKTAPGHHQIEVRDSGCGMSPEVRLRLFEPFYTTKSRGTGLGLTVVQRIVEAHGGSIEVDSTLDKGTTIGVILPRDKNDEQYTDS